jgi:hypothetical protein
VLTIFVAPLAITFLADVILLLAKGENVPTWQSATTLASWVLFLLLLLSGYTDKLDALVVSINKQVRVNKLRNPRIMVDKTL